MIEYLIESICCTGVLFFVCKLILRGSANYRAIRFMLLLAVVFSLLVPLMHISPNVFGNAKTEQMDSIMKNLNSKSYLAFDEVLENQADDSAGFDFPGFIAGVYFVVCFILLSKYFFGLGMLWIKWKNSERLSYQGHFVRLIDQNIPPFTFLQAIFLNRDAFDSNEFEAGILIHEFAHKKQWHSLDVIFMELVKVFFWFNPFIYFFLKRIKANHEYLADEFVLSKGIDAGNYMNLLLEYSTQGKVLQLTSGFNHQLLKNRLMMLAKFQEKKPDRYRILFILPVFLMLFTATAFTNSSIPQNDLLPGHEVKDALENLGTITGDQIFWSAENKRIYIIGRKVKINHGENNVNGSGKFSYLGTVDYFVFNGGEVKMGSTIKINGKTCRVVKLSSSEAQAKYGDKGKNGAVEIELAV
ncbi:MAG: M56 family metallopeptidase [Bacteroidia bacterium]|nr:M56 family metallopeptidase [Bacteroidia bacterium]